MLVHFKLMLRNLRRERFYALINVAGLTLAMICSLLISLHVHQSLTYDDHTSNHNKIYRATITLTNPDGTNSFAQMSDALAPVLARENPDIETYVRFKVLPDHTLLNIHNQPYYEDAIFGTDINVFEVFGHGAIYGDPSNALAEPNGIAISETFNDAHFDGRNSLGELITVNGNDHRVSLVFEDVPNNSHLKYNVLIPIHGPGLASVPADPVIRLFTVNSYTYFVLPKDYNTSQFTSFFDKFWTETTSEVLQGSGISNRMFLTPISDVHFGPAAEYDQPTGNIMIVYAYAVIGLLIMLVAITNYINLAIARATQRFKSTSIQRLLGAKPSSLIMQFLMESISLALVAAVFTCLFMELIYQTGIPIPAINDLNLSEYRSPAIVVVALISALLTGILAGLYPAFWAAQQGFFTRKTAVHKTNRQSISANALIAFQFVVAIAVITCTMLVYNQINYLNNLPLGFDQKNRLVITLKGSSEIAQVPTLRNSLNSLPDVENSAFTTFDPALGFTSGNWRIETDEGQMSFMFLSIQNAGDGYLDTLGIDLVTGRAMNSNDSGRTVVVNETLVRQMGWSNPIGMRTGLPGDMEGSETVVGVVRDFHYEGLQEPVRPLIIRLSRPENYSSIDPDAAFNESARLTLALSDRADDQTLQQIQAIWRRHMPELPFQYQFLDDIVSSRYVGENRLMEALSFFSIVSIFLACLGLFGLTAYRTERRTRELGIRKVLGASPSQLMTTLFKSILFLVPLSALIASALSYYWISIWLDYFAYRDEINLLIFPTAAVMVIALAFLTMTAQAWRTIHRNPVHALRYE